MAYFWCTEGLLPGKIQIRLMQIQVEGNVLCFVASHSITFNEARLATSLLPVFTLSKANFPLPQVSDCCLLSDYIYLSILDRQQGEPSVGV